MEITRQAWRDSPKHQVLPEEQDVYMAQGKMEAEPATLMDELWQMRNATQQLPNISYVVKGGLEKFENSDYGF